MNGMQMNEQTRAKYMHKIVMFDAYFLRGIHYGFSFGQVVAVNSHVHVKPFRDNLMVSSFIEPSNRNIIIIEDLKEVQARVMANLIEYTRKEFKLMWLTVNLVKCNANPDGTFNLSIESNEHNVGTFKRDYLIGKRGGVKIMDMNGNFKPFTIKWWVVS